MRLGWAAASGGALLAVLFAACSSPRTAPVGHTLVEKGAYQASYRPDGRLERLAYDGNGDRRAEALTFFGPQGRPARAEADTDGDGVVDRWEFFDSEGALLKVGSATRGGARADTWTYADGHGGIARIEHDDAADGKADRIEHFADSLLLAVDLDADGDGRCERRLVKDRSGDTLRIETDRDGDGVFESVVPVRR